MMMVVTGGAVEREGEREVEGRQHMAELKVVLVRKSSFSTILHGLIQTNTPTDNFCASIDWRYSLGTRGKGLVPGIRERGKQAWNED